LPSLPSPSAPMPATKHCGGSGSLRCPRQPPSFPAGATEAG